MQETKIQILPGEMELICDAEIIFRKNAALVKVRQFLEAVQLKQQALISMNPFLFPGEVIKISPKISRGENYKGLPWMILDYPRYFEPQHSFAIRTLFWWGNFVSITLHLSGRYKTMYEDKLIRQFKTLVAANFYLCTGAEEWEHHFEPGNYTKAELLKAEKFEEEIRSKKFLKLACKFPLEKTGLPGEKLMESYALLLRLLSGSVTQPVE
jgi:hypothetical protein